MDKEVNGQTDNFKDYFFEYTYSNGDTILKIKFSTDIINGMKTVFQQLKEEELPAVDSQITCSIWDKNAFMSIHSYIETKFPELPNETFAINRDAFDLTSEILRVTKNYSDFFRANLTPVLEKKMIFDCYTDRFYDKVFKEIHYR